MSAKEKRNAIAFVGGWYALNGLYGAYLYNPAPFERAAVAAAHAAARSITPVTKVMRDKVRAWAEKRAMRAQGIYDTEGVAVAAAKAALTGAVKMGPVPGGPTNWRSIPSDSVIGMRGGQKFNGGDIKSLVREAITAGKNHIANAPQLEASTGERYADKARSLNTAAVRAKTSLQGKKPKRNLARAKKAMRK